MVLAFRTHYACAKASLLWHNALLYVANACLPRQASIAGKGKEIVDSRGLLDGEMDEVDGVDGLEGVDDIRDGNDDNGDEARQKIWFLACLAGYRALAPQFPVAKSIFQRLLSMAVRRGGITVEEARSLLDQMKSDSEHSTRQFRPHQGQSSQALTIVTSRVSRAGPNLPVPDVVNMASSSRSIIYGPTARTPSTSDGLKRPPIDSSFIVDLDLSAVNPAAASINTLAGQLDELGVVGEPATGEGEI